MFQCFIIINLVYVINIINAYIECEQAEHDMW